MRIIPKVAFQKIFPKRPYRAKFEYFSRTKAVTEMRKVSNSKAA